MRHLAPKWTTPWSPQRLRQWGHLLVLTPFIWPAAAWAGFTKPFRDVPDHLGTGAFEIDPDWSLAGLVGVVVVIALLAAFYRRDKEE